LSIFRLKNHYNDKCLKTKFLMHKKSKAARIDFIIMVRLVMNFFVVCFWQI
jgi:hypothetical protein